MSPLTQAFNRQASPLSLGAKRPKKSTGGRSITIRVTEDERTALEAEAGQRTLSAYIRSRLFEGKRQRGPDRRPSVDSAALARILALLGRSDMVRNLDVIACAARSGTLESGPALLATLDQARADLALMRHDLISALGIKAD